MKSDARTRYTKHIIREIFLELLEEKPLMKITVKEICDRAEINRGTFYRHYRDCYDLMEQIEGEALEEFKKMLASVEENGAQQVLTAMLNALKRNSTMVRTLAARNGDTSFLNRIIEEGFRYVNMKMPAKCREKTMNDAYVMGGSNGMVEYWLRSGMREAPEAVADRIIKLSMIIGKNET